MSFGCRYRLDIDRPNAGKYVSFVPVGGLGLVEAWSDTPVYPFASRETAQAYASAFVDYPLLRNCLDVVEEGPAVNYGIKDMGTGYYMYFTEAPPGFTWTNLPAYPCPTLGEAQEIVANQTRGGAFPPGTLRIVVEPPS